MLLGILAFIAILALVVLIHEGGHLLAAKRAGMEVTEFGFGFPPRLMGITWRGTLYSLNLIPLGGFVKIEGEDGSLDHPRSFGRFPVLIRIGVVAAGVCMNFLLGFILLVMVATIGVTTALTSDEVPRARDVKVVIAEVLPDSPAFRAGIPAEATILAVDGTPVSKLTEFTSQVAEAHGTPLMLTLETIEGEILEVGVTPRVAPDTDQGSVGIMLLQVGRLRYSFPEALKVALAETWFAVTLIFRTVGQALVSITGAVPVPDVRGPLGVAALTVELTHQGIIPLIRFTAILSLNLAVLNFLPIPALDGGRIFFLLIGRFVKRLSSQLEAKIHTVGFVLLLLLMLLVTLRDLTAFSGLVERIRGLFT
ncbi:MAG: site-2 protease family protein [Parcubacteria group bacterium]|nr:site-2 protease family protein [Parcubacteria group bacterium]